MSGKYQLPDPIKKGSMSVEEALAARRTERDFEDKPISMEQLSTLCWSAQGITTDPGEFPRRAAPSAGAKYPIFLYTAIGENGVEDMAAGVYRYIPDGHGLELVKDGDARDAISKASLGQMWMSHAAVNFVITADYELIEPKYGERGIPYSHYEAGHVAENLMLEAVALGLGAGIVGAFTDEKIAQECSLPEKEFPLLVLPVGHLKK